LFAAAVEKQFLRHIKSKSRACHLLSKGINAVNPPEAHSSARPRLTPKTMLAGACQGQTKGGLPSPGLKEGRSGINYLSAITAPNFRVVCGRKRKAMLSRSLGAFTQYFYSSTRIAKNHFFFLLINFFVVF